MAIIISPLVAGWTVQLETTGQDDTFVRKHPYALPALLNAGFLLLLLLAAFLFLEEVCRHQSMLTFVLLFHLRLTQGQTSKSLRGRFDPGISISKKFLSLFRLVPFSKADNTQYSRINSEEEDGEEMGFLKEVDGNDQSDASTPPSVPVTPSEKNLKLPTRRIFTTNMLLVLLATLLYELHLNSVSVAMANMLVDPVSTKEAELSRVLPFRFGGGAGFQPKSLAWYSTVFGKISTTSLCSSIVLKFRPLKS